MDSAKLSLLDDALRSRYPPAGSVADLGGVWGVDGGYAFWVRERFDVARVVIADSDFSEAALGRCRATPGVEAVHGLLGDPSVVARVGDVDAIILFDVLLHQVAPDWDELLAMYAPHTRCFVVFNPQWTGGGESFRLLELWSAATSRSAFRTSGRARAARSIVRRCGRCCTISTRSRFRRAMSCRCPGTRTSGTES